MNRTSFVIAAALGVLVATASFVRAEDEMQGHRFGEWPAISAVIAHEQQKNLDLGDKDFLIEIWFKPLPVLKYKGNGPNILVSKKCADALPGYTLAYQGENVTLTLCDKARELQTDLGYSANAGLKEGQWCYLAVACGRKDKQLTFYKDGKVLRTFRDVTLGDLSNKDTFNISYFENGGNTQAHCEISQVRLWRFAEGLPAGVATAIGAHAAKPDAVTEAPKCDSSRWVFTGDEKATEAKDLGNNGNTLLYAPLGIKDAFKLLPIPDKTTGATRYVDRRSPAADDKGEGTKDKPFKTIRAGLRATGPGDLLHICAGEYRETITPRAGENGRPVTIEGEEGAIIRATDPITGWQAAGDGVWRLTGWKGHYLPPGNPKERDERSNPGHLLFVDGYPLDYVKTLAELVPGTWNVQPALGYGPKTITICPLPGVDPARTSVEITSRPAATMTKFSRIRNLRFIGGTVGLRGIGNVLENCTLEWEPYCTLGIYGQYHTVRGNTIRWGGDCGVAGSAYALVFENNLLEYNAWRNFYASWGGGAIKFIPSNCDHVMRNNEFRFNQIAAIWYDSNNQGNLIEGNKVHDNATGGFFDEFCFGNTVQYNLFYNNVGAGLAIANTAEDRVYRNITYNSGGGLFFRYGPKVRNTPEGYESAKAEFGGKFDVRRYQGIIPYERLKKYRDALDRYTWQYPEGSINGANQIVENVFMNNTAWGGLEVNQPNNFANRKTVDPDQVSTFEGNIYWNDRGEKIFNDGTYCTRNWTFKEWQELSGQDKDGRWMDPLENPDKMPQWFRERFPFKKGDFRPLDKTTEDFIPNVKGGVPRTVLLSRLLRAKRIEKLSFADPMLFGLSFDSEGRKCLALWTRSAGMREFVVAGADNVTLENRFLQHKALAVDGGRMGLYVGEDPITLIGLETIRDDRSVLLEAPQWTEPGKPVKATVTLENMDNAEKAYDLKVTAGPRWKVSGGEVKRTLKAGEKAQVAIELTPAQEIWQGSFQLQVAGTAGGKAVSQSKHFGVGSLLVLKHVLRTPRVGQDAAWEVGGVNGVAQTKDQVVQGQENWKGSGDLSAKAYLTWRADRELFMAIDVTDDMLVTNHRDDAAARSDSVELIVDVRAPWKQFMKEYTPGVLRIVFVPGDDKNKATFKYLTTTFGDIVACGSRRTAKGYRIEADLHFHGGEVEDPGWVAGRAVRIGILVRDADDAAGKNVKTMGVWRTAADATEDCTSLTTFVTEKPEGK